MRKYPRCPLQPGGRGERAADQVCDRDVQPGRPQPAQPRAPRHHGQHPRVLHHRRRGGASHGHRAAG